MKVANESAESVIPVVNKSNSKTNIELGNSNGGNKNATNAEADMNST